MHYNDRLQRQLLTLEYERARGYSMFAERKEKLCIWVNLCIHPYSWERVYHSIRRGGTVPYEHWEALGGAIMSLMVNTGRFSMYTAELISECQPDFVEYIRSDNVGDPWKFILSMRRYLPRYITLKALYRYGLDWRKLAFESAGAKTLPGSKTYHSLFTNLYVRSIIKCMVVFRQYREPGDEDYNFGTNDCETLLRRESASAKCVSYDAFCSLFDRLKLELPSYSPAIRNRVAYYMSYLLPLHYLTEKQMLPSLERQVLGTNSRD